MKSYTFSFDPWDVVPSKQKQKKTLLYGYNYAHFLLLSDAFY